MLAKKNRLPLGDAKRVAPQKSFSSPWFLLKVFKNTEGHNRIAVIVANSAVKKSARRHFWKRQFMGMLSLWPNMQRDFLIVVSPKIEGATKKTIQGELSGMLEKLAISQKT